MQINVAQLLKEQIGSTRNCAVDAAVDVAGNDSRVQGEVKLTRTDRAVLVEGVLHTEVQVSCGRCLSMFNCPLTIKIEEEYYPAIDVLTGAPLSLADEPGSFTIDEHHNLDLTEAIRQYVMVAIPMKPLCREDCAGLCPQCGKNLNQGPCGCRPEKMDSRLTKLAELVPHKKRK
ncbi:DUF177 domain-containing protein [Chloroflexota bacterium]